MTLALIRHEPEAIVATFPEGTGRIRLPVEPETYVHAPADGWAGEGFRIAAVVPAETPAEGKVAVGSTVILMDGDPVEVLTVEDAPPEPRRRVDKWVIAERIEAAGKSDAAYDLLTMPGNRSAFIKWNMPVESVYFDDAATVAMLAALDLDPEVILAPG